MFDSKGEDNDAPSYIETVVQGLKIAFRSVYGTDMHISLKEERDHAAEAIIRMAYEADSMRNNTRTLTMNADQALKAMVKDLET